MNIGPLKRGYSMGSAPRLPDHVHVLRPHAARQGVRTQPAPAPESFGCSCRGEVQVRNDRHDVFRLLPSNAHWRLLLENWFQSFKTFQDLPSTQEAIWKRPFSLHFQQHGATNACKRVCRQPLVLVTGVPSQLLRSLASNYQGQASEPLGQRHLRQ